MRQRNSIHYRKMINSARWRDTRKQAMRRAEYLCEDCQLHGRVTLATEVHHVRPVEWAHTDRQREALMFDLRNLVALCHECHRTRHRTLGSHNTAARAERARIETDAMYNNLFGTTQSREEAHPRGVFFKEGEGGTETQPPSVPSV